MITPLGIKSDLEKAKRTGKDVYCSDDTGQRLGWRLQLRCMPSGSATWLFRYTHEGKRFNITLGNFKSLNINLARKSANFYSEIYDQTTDVLGKLRADEEAKKASLEAERTKAEADQQEQQKRDKYTLSGLMSLYVDYLKKNGKDASSRDAKSLSKHLAALADKPASKISKRDLLNIQRKLLEAGKGRTANKLRSYVRAAYALIVMAETDATAPAAAADFATFGGVESNPAALLAVAKGYNGTRDRVLTNPFLIKSGNNDAGEFGAGKPNFRIILKIAPAFIVWSAGRFRPLPITAIHRSTRTFSAIDTLLISASRVEINLSTTSPKPTTPRKLSFIFEPWLKIG